MAGNLANTTTVAYSGEKDGQKQAADIMLNYAEKEGLTVFWIYVSSCLYEITEIADREMKKPGGGRALLFEKPTIGGKPSPFPLAINALGSDRRMVP